MELLLSFLFELDPSQQLCMASHVSFSKQRFSSSNVTSTVNGHQTVKNTTDLHNNHDYLNYVERSQTFGNILTLQTLQKFDFQRGQTVIQY